MALNWFAIDGNDGTAGFWGIRVSYEGSALSDGAKRVPGQEKDTTVTQEDVTVNIAHTAGTRAEPGMKMNTEISHRAHTVWLIGSVL